MTTGYNAHFLVILRKYNVAILAFFCMLGAHFGILISANSVPVTANLMRSTVHSPVSIVGSFCHMLVPFLICSICVHLHAYAILPFLFGIRSFFLGFSGCGIGLAFGAAAWLMRILFLLCRQLSFVLLILFYLYLRSGKAQTPKALSLFYMGSMILWAVDVFLLAPFLASVI